jgi:hypothetical protein
MEVLPGEGDGQRARPSALADFQRAVRIAGRGERPLQVFVDPHVVFEDRDPEFVGVGHVRAQTLAGGGAGERRDRVAEIAGRDQDGGKLPLHRRDVGPFAERLRQRHRDLAVAAGLLEPAAEEVVLRGRCLDHPFSIMVAGALHDRPRAVERAQAFVVTAERGLGAGKVDQRDHLSLGVHDALFQGDVVLQRRRGLLPPALDHQPDRLIRDGMRFEVRVVDRDRAGFHIVEGLIRESVLADLAVQRAEQVLRGGVLAVARFVVLLHELYRLAERRLRLHVASHDGQDLALVRERDDQRLVLTELSREPHALLLVVQRALQIPGLLRRTAENRQRADDPVRVAAPPAQLQSGLPVTERVAVLGKRVRGSRDVHRRRGHPCIVLQPLIQPEGLPPHLPRGLMPRSAEQLRPLSQQPICIAPLPCVLESCQEFHVFLGFLGS